MKKVILTTALLGLTIVASGVTHAATIKGTSNDDLLLGTRNADQMYGYKGKDRIFGDNGHDTIYGGGSADFIFGGAGRDKIWGQNGSDEIDTGAPQQSNHTEIQGGGSGNDTCYNADHSIGNIQYSSCENIENGSI